MTTQITKTSLGCKRKLVDIHKVPSPLGNIDTNSGNNSQTAKRSRAFLQPPPATTNADLPAPLWANVVDFLFMDEAMQVSSVNKFFLGEVSPLVTQLLVRKSCNLKLGSPSRPSLTERLIHLQKPASNVQEKGSTQKQKEVEKTDSPVEVSNGAVTSRFPGVRRVVLYSFISELRCGFETLDVSTMKQAVPFLKSFPKLGLVLFSGLRSTSGQAGWIDNQYIRYDLFYCVHRSYANISRRRHRRCMQNLLNDISSAYSSGAFSSDVNVVGLVQTQKTFVPFRKSASSASHCAYRSISTCNDGNDDVKQDCSVCHCVCQRFPPAKVLRLNTDQVPCLEVQQRLEMALERIPIIKRPKALTDVLVDTLYGEQRYHQKILSTYNYPEVPIQAVVTSFHDEAIERIQWLVLHGANVKDPRLRHVLVDTIPPQPINNSLNEAFFSKNRLVWEGEYPKRILDKEVFLKLVQSGLNLSPTDFWLVEAKRACGTLLALCRPKSSQMTSLDMFVWDEEDDNEEEAGNGDHDNEENVGYLFDSTDDEDDGEDV